jgi:hypothetical protein
MLKGAIAIFLLEVSVPGQSFTLKLATTLSKITVSICLSFYPERVSDVKLACDYRYRALPIKGAASLD